MGRPEGQGSHYSYAQGHPAMAEYDYPEEVLEDDTTYADWDDHGEGSSHGTGGRNSHRGDRRYRQ